MGRSRMDKRDEPSSNGRQECGADSDFLEAHLTA